MIEYGMRIVAAVSSIQTILHLQQKGMQTMWSYNTKGFVKRKLNRFYCFTNFLITPQYYLWIPRFKYV